MISAGALGAYGYGVVRYGIGTQAGTCAFMSLTISQLLHAISCRSEDSLLLDWKKLPNNKFLSAALAGSFGLQFLAYSIPGLRGLLGLGSIGILDACWIGISATVPLLVNEITKKPLMPYLDAASENSPVHEMLNPSSAILEAPVSAK